MLLCARGYGSLIEERTSISSMCNNNNNNNTSKGQKRRLTLSLDVEDKAGTCASSSTIPSNEASLIFSDGQGFNLYLGGMQMAMDCQGLHAAGVGFILNVTKTVPNFFQDQFTYLRVSVEDNSFEELSGWFEACRVFIETARNMHVSILVHCQYGMSRSASIVLAYIMKSQNYTLCQSIELVKEQRPQVSPNPNFMAQLTAYEKSLFSRVSIDMNHFREDRFSSASELALDTDDAMNFDVDTDNTDTTTEEEDIYGMCWEPVCRPGRGGSFF